MKIINECELKDILNELSHCILDDVINGVYIIIDKERMVVWAYYIYN
jgi:hypothetical protein